MKKPSAANVDALRWRQMFQEVLSGLLASGKYVLNYENPELIELAASLTDEGLKKFYSRYEKEAEPKAPKGFIK